MFDRTEMSVEEHAYWEGVASRQAEIDELRKEANKEREEATEYFTDLEFANAKCRELQKRIDEVELWIVENKRSIALSEWHGWTTEEYVDADDLLDILKGTNQ